MSIATAPGAHGAPETEHLAHLEALYADRADPWDYARSTYELTKYGATLAALPRAAVRDRIGDRQQHRRLHGAGGPAHRPPARHRPLRKRPRPVARPVRAPAGRLVPTRRLYPRRSRRTLRRHLLRRGPLLRPAVATDGGRAQDRWLACPRRRSRPGPCPARGDARLAGTCTATAAPSASIASSATPWACRSSPATRPTGTRYWSCGPDRRHFRPGDEGPNEPG